MIVLIGFTAAIAQIVLLRELMVVFYGNEISIGLMLASWLVWTAAGSSAAGWVAARSRSPRRLMAAIEVLIALALPATILAVRAAKGLLTTVPGEVLGPGAMLLTSLAALGPLCVLSGSLFPAGAALYAEASEVPAGRATPSVYLWEAVGSSAGGLAAGLLLVRYLESLEIAWLLAVLNLVAAAGLAIPLRRWRRAAIGALAGLAVLGCVSGALRRAEALSQVRFWRGQHLIATRNSVYGSLAVVGTEASRSIYENGVVLCTVPDPAAAEEAAHYALLEHPSPRSLLLIGGGINGSITEALRHPSIERVDYVELDPAILDLARDYFPREWGALRSDPRVRIHISDGRLFLKTTPSSFDVVIVNLPDPQNAQLNRFFTVEFFREVSRRLTPSGLLSFQLRSSENYIGSELAQFLRSIGKSLRTVFPEVAAIPGETVHFFAARREGVLAADAEELLARWRARHLDTLYVSDAFIPFRMAPDRMLELETRIRPLAATPENHDFAPVAYYFDVALWSSQFGTRYSRFFGTLAAVPFNTLLAVIAVVLAAAATAGRYLAPKEDRARWAAASCTAATGFTMIGLEVLLLLAFQAVYGYVYRELAVIIAVFMAGMAVGSWLAMRRGASSTRTLAATQTLTAAAPLLVLGMLEIIVQAGGSLQLAASRVAFPVLAMISGMLGGFEFSLASRIFFEGPAPRRAGTLYALDLAGSCLGALLFSIWFIPVFGFFKTALLSAVVSLPPAATALRTRSPAGAPRTPAP